MYKCYCGNIIEDESELCPRCQALKVLELTSSATPALIEDNYRQLHKIWNPDGFLLTRKWRRRAEEKFKGIAAAYEWLHATNSLDPPQTLPIDPEDDDGDDDEPLLLRSRWRILFADPRVQSGLQVLALCAGLALAVPLVDAVISSLPSVGPNYITFKTNFRNGISVRLHMMAQSFTGKHDEAAVSPPAETQPVEDANASAPPTPQRSRQQIARQAAAAPHVSGVEAYVTLGLKPAEVIAVLGQPTSSTPRALNYGASAIYINNGSVSGWKIDPAAPLRVKLWPSHPVDPTMDAFTTGSTRDEVIAVMGTPTLVLDNKYGYGKSQVFFDGRRVTGWLNNSKSIPLKVHEE